MNDLRTIPKLAIYYAVTAFTIIVLVENSIILSSQFESSSDISYVGSVALALAFLPRVVSFASSIDRGRSVLIALLAPLTLTSLALAAFKPLHLALRIEPFQLAILGLPVTISLGEICLFTGAKTGLLKPEMSLEGFDHLKIEETMISHLESYCYQDLLALFSVAFRKKRLEQAGAILSTIKMGIEAATEQRNVFAKCTIARAIVQSMRLDHSLRLQLLEVVKGLSSDAAPEVVTAVLGAYEFLIDYPLAETIPKLWSLAGSPDPRVRRKVVDICLKKWNSSPEIPRIFLSSMEHFVRDVHFRIPLNTSLLAEEKNALDPERDLLFMSGELDSLQDPRLHSGVFEDEDFENLLARAWDIEPVRMSSIVTTMLAGSLDQKLTAIKLLSNSRIGPKIIDRVGLLSLLAQDKNPLIRMAMTMQGERQ